MRIGFLTERMLLGYGVDLVTDRLARGLSELGHEVTVYCSFHDDTFAGRYDLLTLNVPSSILASRYESRAEKAIRPHEKQQDIWIVESFPFFKAAGQFEKPWIAVDYGVVPSESFPLLKRREFNYIRRTQYGEYFHRASKIACVSHFLRRMLPPELSEKATVIHLGIDHYDRDSLVDLRTEVGLGPDEVTILYQGRSSDTSPYKGVDILLDIYSRLRREVTNVRLLISTICSPEEQARLERANAIVLNGVLPPFIPSVYQCADIFATATQWEGFDLPLLEASYFGLPVVAFDVGAHREIVKEGQTGYLANNLLEFSDRLKELIGSSESRKRMGDAGAAFAAQFKWRNAVQEFATVLHEAARIAA